jgi:folate-binding protein YgfZ
MTSKIKLAVLPDRGIVSVYGPDAMKLLQGLVTNDIALLDTQPAIHTGLLSPQGKILFDFFIVKAPEGALLDVARDHATALAKRLTMYKLRASVSIADVSADHAIVAVFGDDARFESGFVYHDPRMAALGLRAIVVAGWNADLATTEAAEYQSFRIGLGVPEGGQDYAFGDAFPHEALFDQLHGVSFSKGCYVGQEIVSRMEHRGTARKRIVPVNAGGGLLVAGTPVLAGDVEIGRIGSVAGSRALAMLRLDRAEEFEAIDVPLTAGTSTLTVDIPAWAHFKPIAAHS